MSDRVLRSQIAADYRRVAEHPEKLVSWVYLRDLLTHPGLMFCLLLRLQGRAVAKGHGRVGDLLRSVNVTLTGGDVVSGALIGTGLLVQHPTGIVIGHGTRIGTNCTLLQGVTLGERDVRGESGRRGYPSLGDDVVVGAGAYVLGSVQVGRGATIGAKSLVLDDVPPGGVVVGIPARLVRQDDRLGDGTDA